MGAENISIITVWPEKIDDATWAKADAVALDLNRLFSSLAAKLAHDDSPDVSLELCCSTVTELGLALTESQISSVFDNLIADGFEAWNSEGLEELADHANQAVTRLKDFIAGDFRDTTYRQYDDRMIYSCGEMTWGDAPEGRGYQACKWMYLLGLDDVLGVK